MGSADVIPTSCKRFVGAARYTGHDAPREAENPNANSSIATGTFASGCPDEGETILAACDFARGDFFGDRLEVRAAEGRKKIHAPIPSATPIAALVPLVSGSGSRDGEEIGRQLPGALGVKRFPRRHRSTANALPNRIEDVSGS